MPVPIWAGHYIGLPFKDHGRDRTGLDCWGLVRMVMIEQYNIALPSFPTEYDRVTNSERISQLILRETPRWDQVPQGREETGDVIVLRLRGKPMHVGMVVGDRQMLHIEMHINSAIERYNSTHWIDRIHGFYRYRKSYAHDTQDRF